MGTVELTDKGEHRVENAGESPRLADTPKGAILTILYEEGPQTSADLADRLGTSNRKTASFLKALESEGCVDQEEQ